MQVGDKRQAGMLGVVAVGAIGFLIFQLVPKADAHAPAPQRPAPSAAVAAGDPPPVAPVPAKSADVILERDPFAVAPRARPRPSVASASDPANEDADAPAAKAGKSPAERPRPGDLLPMTAPALTPSTFDASGSLPSVAASVPQSTAPTPGKAPSVKASPKASATVDGAEKAPERKATPVALLGIVEMPAPVAMVRVGTVERTLRVGDEIVPGFRIAKITLAGITFVNRPGRSLAPGEETLL